MKKTSKPLICGAGRGISLLFGVLLAGILLGTSAFAMEATGEAGITPDPPAQETVVSIPPQSAAPEQPVSSAPSSGAVASDVPVSSTPASGTPASSAPSSSETASDLPASSSGELTSGWESGETDSGLLSSAPESGLSSEPERDNSTPSQPVSSSTSSRSDSKASYVEYIPPKTSGSTGHTTSAQKPLAVAPKDDKTEILSSQNWEELLSTPSSLESEPQDTSAVMTPVPMGGIFGKNQSAGGASIVLIVGIVALALGVGGVGFFIYSQFFHKRRASADEPSEDTEETLFSDFSATGEHHWDRTLPVERTDRDISSFSDPNKKPANPLHLPQQDAAPKQKQVEDVDWDQFFKDNQ